MSDFFGPVRLSSDSPPNLLYHYTSQAGLIGILRESEIWMTHTQYLNDQQEFNHAVDFVRGEINKRMPTASTEERSVLDEMRDNVSPDASSINVCVCCFSEDGDSLSQWRAYGEALGGYSIAFTGQFLSNLAAHEGFALAQCIYEDSRKAAIVRDFVEAILREILNNRTPDKSRDDDYHWSSGGNLGVYLNRIAPVFKDYAFRHEREWRIISRPLSCTRPGFEYRAGKSMIIPYYKLPIANRAENVGETRLHSVMIGPTPNMVQAKRAVGSLLASQHLANEMTPGGPVQVFASSVPYRSW
jgi:hypothetical protein